MNRFFVYGLALMIFAADQAAKIQIDRHLEINESRPYTPFFSLTLVHNTGGAFGIFASGTWLLALASAAASVAIIAYTRRTHGPLPRLVGLGLALPLGGALGNLLDRVRLHYVVDFLDFHIGRHQWPVFNIADSAICIGVALLAIHFGRASEPASVSAP